MYMLKVKFDRNIPNDYVPSHGAKKTMVGEHKSNPPKGG